MFWPMGSITGTAQAAVRLGTASYFSFTKSKTKIDHTPIVNGY
jgi:hypothetical protein